MKIISWIYRLLIWTTTFFLMTVTHASPVWTFFPLTSTSLSIMPGDTAFISYSVTNQSKTRHTLVMTSIPGISQVTGGGNCGNPFSLGYQQSCTLVLQISGSSLTGNVIGGPKVCEQGNGLECYQPSFKYILNIIKIPLPPGPSPTTLSVSISSLALSVNNTGLNAALTGRPRILTITNTGANSATNVTVNTTTLPAGTTITPTSCGTIAPGGTCILTITPGATPSAAPGNTNPTPITLSIQGDNTNTLAPTVNILTYGSVYQSGFLFSVDDTTPNTGSIGGKVASLTDQADFFTTGSIWSSDGTGAPVFDNIPGINENSTNPPDACDGNLDGVCNTNVIVAYYSPPQTNPAVNLSFYAAGLCKATIDGFSDWYLPAICEMGYRRVGPVAGCGTQASPSLQNMQSNLVENGVGSLAGPYWSSTQSSINVPNNAWDQFFANAATTFQDEDGKQGAISVRCVRALTP